MTDIRKAFIDELVGTIRTQENMTVHGIYPDGNPIEGFHNGFSNDYKAGVAAGRNIAVQAMLSITDSREDNKANWRLTAVDGEIVGFYPKDNPDGIPTKRDDGELEYVNGLIADFFDKVNS